MKRWQCTVCKYIHEGEEPPEFCPVCKAPASKFIELNSDESSLKEKEKTEKNGDNSSPGKISGNLLEQFKKTDDKFDFICNLLVQHHAHPISVHVPNGVIPIAFIMFFLTALFHIKGLADAGFYNLVFVVFSLPFVIFAGYLEWKKKYNMTMTPIFKIKIISASIAAITCFISVTWFLFDADVLESDYCWLFIFLNLIMLGATGIAGHMGGKLVFKE